MTGIGMWEALICVAVFAIPVLGIVAGIVAIIVAGGSKAPAQPDADRPKKPEPSPSLPLDRDSQILVVARITQRFCPQCRSPLAPDAPEGLCPACLMAGALGSEVDVAPANGMAATTPPSGSKPPLVGEIGDLQQHFPGLEILELLGRGGMGAVYKARQKNLDRIVALKVIPPEAAKDPTFAERFGREARALARLNHPCIVTVYDFGQVGELHYLLMEYVDGVNLRQTLRAGRLAPREAVAIVPPICDALQYAHDQGVVHRDIKPENVLLDRSGRVKIADFGLAKLLGKGPDDFTLTRTQQIMGTPRYMAPEQIEKPSTVDHRADIYSLGVVIYEMLTGELPIGRFEPPSHKVQIDVRIDEVVLRSLEKDPQRRYQRASEVKTELASATSWPFMAAATPAGEEPGLRGSNGPFARPSWHTPAPATKSDAPGGVPLAHVLMVAMGMVLGVLMMTAGLAGAIYAMTWGFQGFSGPFWGWMGAAFGCIVGGAGSAVGSYNTYRQMAGAEDLMLSPRTTWFDWVMRVYLAIGFALLMWGALLVDGNPKNWQPLVTLGGIAALQGLLFLVIRTLYVLGAKPQGGSTPRDPAREALQAPAMGLLIGGIAAICLGGIALATILILLAIGWLDTDFIALAVTNLIVALPVGIILILGGLSMRSARSRSLATIACIVGIVPNGLAWPITLPLAIWALVMLREPRARRVFASNEDQSEVANQETPQGASVPARDPAHEALQAPGMGLLLGGITAIFLGGIGLATLVIILASGRFEPRTDNAIFAGLAVANFIVALPVGIILILGGLSLRSARSRSLATIACIVGIIPNGLAWPITLPLAIWALVMLREPRARQAFASSEDRPEVANQEASRADLSPAPRNELPIAHARIRRRVAGPAIGLMIAGVIGLLPMLLALLAIPTTVLIPSGGSMQPIREEIGEPAPIAGMLLPLGSLLVAPTPGLSLVLPILVAQDGSMALADPRGPLWGLVMLGVVMFLSLPLSITMIVGGWRMMLLKSYGLAMVASIMALLPCTFGWFLGLPMGIWALITLLNGDVRDAFDRDPTDPHPAAETPPKAGPERHASPPAVGARRVSPALIAVAGLVFLVGGGILVALLLPAIQSARAAAKRAHSTNNLKQISIALHNYHDMYRAFPPAVVTDAGGRELYSGRVLLLPFLDQQPLYDSFDLTQPWDSDRNRPLSGFALQVFMDPLNESDRPRSDYLFVTGTGTILEAGKSVRLEDVTSGDGSALTMLMVEVKGSGASWAEPRELNISKPGRLPNGNHAGGNLVLFADGSVQFVENETLTPSKVRAMATYDGGELLEVDPNDFARLLQSLRRETFDSGKLSFVRTVSRMNSFSSEQARQLLEQFDFDNDRVEAAVLLYPRLTDPENFFRVLEVFSFDSGRESVRKRLKLE